jgi:hypothetical protein
MENISSFEALRLTFINSPISKTDKITPREVILGLTRLEKELKSIKIFISVEKDKNRNYLLYYKSKYQCLPIADYLAAVIIK